MLTLLSILLTVISDRVRTLRADQRGYSTEVVVVTGLLVALAMAVLVIITNAVIDKANRLPL